MKYDPQKHHRRSIRLKGYDYTQAGAYFITICVHNRECLFGEIIDGEMRLNEYGQIVAEEWAKSSEIRKEIEMDEWVVMPNHIHGIVVIADSVGAHGVGAHGRAPLRAAHLQRQPRSLGSFVAGSKSATTKRINMMRGTQGAPVWQDNYYEHIVRNENDLNRIREYIINNPARWDADQENPSNVNKAK
ncbi:hypothetical protein ANRL3_00918 [Anaerolineae bacterium]|nr:hypothetical protein ANRL3_00918 [Anaerolineae bacterium]